MSRIQVTICTVSYGILAGNNIPASILALSCVLWLRSSMKLGPGITYDQPIAFSPPIERFVTSLVSREFISHFKFLINESTAIHNNVKVSSHIQLRVRQSKNTSGLCARQYDFNVFLQINRKIMSFIAISKTSIYF